MSRLRDLIEYLEAVEQVVDKKYHDTPFVQGIDCKIKMEILVEISKCVAREEKLENFLREGIYATSESSRGVIESLAALKYKDLSNKVNKKLNK